MRTHIFFKHCLPAHRTNQEQDEEDDDDDDDEERHERDPIWVDEMVEKSKVFENDSLKFVCCLCGDFSSNQMIGLRLHIFHKHCVKLSACKKQREVKAEPDEEKHERDPLWVEQMVKNSKRDSSSRMWDCCLCKYFKTNHLNSMRSHILQIHCVRSLKKCFDQDGDEMKEIEEERHEKDPIWINEMVEKSNTYGKK